MNWPSVSIMRFTCFYSSDYVLIVSMLARLAVYPATNMQLIIEIDKAMIFPDGVLGLRDDAASKLDFIIRNYVYNNLCENLYWSSNSGESVPSIARYRKLHKNTIKNQTSHRSKEKGLNICQTRLQNPSVSFRTYKRIWSSYQECANGVILLLSAVFQKSPMHMSDSPVATSYTQPVQIEDFYFCWVANVNSLAKFMLNSPFMRISLLSLTNNPSSLSFIFGWELN